MMMKKKFVAVALSAVCLLSAVGCGQQSASTASSASSVSSSVASSASASQVMDAEDYLSGISGTYVELFPEMAKSEYRNLWIDAATPLVGEDNAESATDMLLGMWQSRMARRLLKNMQQIRTARRSTAIFWAAWKNS
jgi:maltose-binding protein MalE